MPKREGESFKTGSIEMLLLYLLTEDDYYGYQLSQMVKKRSNGILQVPEGSMYPTLYRLAEKGYVTYERKQAGKRLKRVYYHLEPFGREYLAGLLHSYRMVEKGITMIMGDTSADDIRKSGPCSLTRTTDTVQTNSEDSDLSDQIETDIIDGSDTETNDGSDTE